MSRRLPDDDLAECSSRTCRRRSSAVGATTETVSCLRSRPATRSPREPWPRVGEQRLLKDHAGRTRARLETTRVKIVPLPPVREGIAQDEGEAFRDVASWRAEHVRFWREIGTPIRLASGDPGWVLHDDEPVVVEWFHVVGDWSPANEAAGTGEAV